jgi:hypothetical protein
LNDAPLTLELLPVRLVFRATGVVRFPPGQPGNIIRGTFGSIFRRSVCPAPSCSAAGCERFASCPYITVFEPPKPAGWPSGFANPPRGFVFRAHHLDGRIFSPGEPFHADLHLFHLSPATLAHFVRTFTTLGQDGLGPGRGRAVLDHVDLLGEDGSPRRPIPLDPDRILREPIEPLALDLRPAPGQVRRAVVRFATPAELKAGGRLAGAPEFAVLMARIRDRVSTLRALYGAGALPLDFQRFAAEAARVRLVRASIARVKAERRSSRTGQRHPIGGFVGEAEYEGELAAFLPYLRAARWTGAGRQTVWGKGDIEVAVPAGREP